MSNLDDLGYKPITEMSTDEALELLRQIRLNRRLPTKTKSTKKSTKTQRKEATSGIDPELAAELLKMLGG